MFNLASRESAKSNSPTGTLRTDTEYVSTFAAGFGRCTVDVALTTAGILETVVVVRAGSACRWSVDGFLFGRGLHALMIAATRTVVARTGSVTGGKGILLVVSF